MAHDPSPSALHPLLIHLRGILLLTPFALHLLLADLLLSLLLPLSLLAPDAVYHTCSRIAEGVWAHIQHIFEHTNGAQIIISGDKLPSPSTSTTAPESAIVVANHRAWADFYMIQSVARRAGMLGYCRWFAKSQLKRVPLLGWGLWAMGMPLVTRNWTSDTREMERVFRGPVARGWPVWLVSFSEATRFTARKYEEGVGWCRETGRPVMRHVLYPRFKGWVAPVRGVRGAGQVRAVYDFTIAYAKRGRGDGDGGQVEWRFMEAPDIWTTLARPRLREDYRFWVNVRRFELEKLPVEAKELEKWLETRWVEKGEMLERLRLRIKAGEAPHKLELQ